jgi:hypothetical protein
MFAADERITAIIYRIEALEAEHSELREDARRLERARNILKIWKKSDHKNFPYEYCLKSLDGALNGASYLS